MRSMFSFEGEYNAPKDERCGLRVVAEDGNPKCRAMYIRGDDAPLITATEEEADATHQISFKASSAIENFPDLILLLAAMGLYPNKTEDGYTFEPKFCSAEFGPKGQELPKIEVIWNRLSALDYLWIANRCLAQFTPEPETVSAQLVSIHQKAHTWNALRAAEFLEETKSVDEKTLKKCMKDLRGFASWGINGLTKLRIIDEPRCYTAFEIFFGERKSLHVNALEVNWAVAPRIGAGIQLPASVSTGKYAIRPTKIPNEVIAVLDGLLVQGKTVKIVKELDKKLYGKVNAMLETIGGKWNTSAQAHVFEDDPQEMLDEMTATGAIYTRSDFEFFETQEEEVNHALVMADLEPGMTVLEPSAGRGAFALAAAQIVGKRNVICYELMEKNVKALRAAGFDVNEPQDFMAVPAREVADVVLMNPPFSGGRDIAHIQHAYDFLKPGGRLVAIASTQWQTNTKAPAKAFQAFLNGLGASVKPIEAGAFRAVGTEVATTLITLIKPMRAEKPIERHKPTNVPQKALIEDAQAALF